ncbi:hypothetical protein A5686_18170 [Mycobacterium sp. E2479]|nr:hypothetical protein A5686_18170 [Mycobacterium sp. E2479]
MLFRRVAADLGILPLAVDRQAFADCAKCPHAQPLGDRETLEKWCYHAEGARWVLVMFGRGVSAGRGREGRSEWE